MELNKKTFLNYYNRSREDNKWDFKEDIYLSDKSSFLEFLKDVLAFSNYGGGFLLLGVKDDCETLVGVENEIDEAEIGQKIEDTLGFSIGVKVFYFDYNVEGRDIKLGLIYIPGSDKPLACPKTLNNSENKCVIKKGDLLYRRNTRSIKANTEDIEEIISRINDKGSKKRFEINEEENKIKRQLSKGKVGHLHDVVYDRYNFNAVKFGKKLEEIWFEEADYSKEEFASLIGVSPDKIDRVFKGLEIPQLIHIHRATKIFNLPSDFFFKPSLYMRSSFWKNDIVKYAIFSLIEPKSSIALIGNKGEFYGNLFFDLAESIKELYEWLFNKNKRVKLGLSKSRFDELTENLLEEELKKLKKDLSTQYYKVLEQYPNSKSNKFTTNEKIVHNWCCVGGGYIERIVLESIKEINIENPEKPCIEYYWDKEIKNGMVIPKWYDEDNLQMKTK